MLATFRDCLDEGTNFTKDLQWFRLYASSSNGVSLIEEDVRQTMDICVDAYCTGCGALYRAQPYHTIFPQVVVDQGHPICDLEPIKLLAPTLDGCGYTTSWQVQEQSYSGMCQADMDVMCPA